MTVYRILRLVASLDASETPSEGIARCVAPGASAERAGALRYHYMEGGKLREKEQGSCVAG
jgi:hypothetical protein